MRIGTVFADEAAKPRFGEASTLPAWHLHVFAAIGTGITAATVKQTNLPDASWIFMAKLPARRFRCPIGPRPNPPGSVLISPFARP